ncbi:DUF2840 domain-containing protein [Xanthomonas theicola]|uniref:DUF2840 domain-containing protein n=1 Tax=Xanthomonas theicola TaxID=56464 RepID=UPI0036106980
MTTVELAYQEGVCNVRLLYGNAMRIDTLAAHAGHTRQRAYFGPGAVFGLDLWERNGYGTTAWRVIVARTVQPGQPARRMPCVRPGAYPLLDVQGATRARAALRWLADHGDALAAIAEHDYLLAQAHFARAPLARLRAYLEASK